MSILPHIKSTVVVLFIAILAGCTGEFAKNSVIAHRGAWKAKGYPENSIAALKQAVKLGVRGTEFDVHITKDDSLVVNHDADFHGLVIGESTYEELLTKELSNQEKIPTLREYIHEGTKQENTKLILEIKAAKTKERTLELTRKAVSIVKTMQAEKWVEYITFDYDAGMLVHELDPEAEIAYLNGDVAPAQAKSDGFTGLDYHYKKYRQNPEWISEAHDLGLTINAWTVNSEEEMRYLIGQGADYITTNEPELLFKILSEKNK